jgi:hypothetical protein
MPSSAIWPAGLDETTQRQLILRAVKQCAPDRIDEFRAKQLTFNDLDRELRENGWVAAIFCWLLLPVLALIEVSLLLRLRNTVASNAKIWLDNPDPECEMWTCVAAVRSTLKRVPRRARPAARPIHAELKRVEKHWADLDKRLATIDQALGALSGSGLPAKREALVAQIAAETDDTTRGTLERSLIAVEGQLATRETLDTWRRRLRSAQSECLEGLARLSSHLALLAASDHAIAAPPMAQVTENLQSINLNLSSMQEASEEVMTLQARG